MEIKKVVTLKTATKVSAWLKEFNFLDVDPERIMKNHYVMVEDGKIVGGVGVGRSNHFSKELFHLFVLPEYRGKGYAKQAIAYACENARKAGKTSIFSTVRWENTPCLQLKQSMGFAVLYTYPVPNEERYIAVLHKCL